MDSMREMKLDYGATYYRVTYADPQRSMPGLTPLIYVGDNLVGDESDKTHYFQDTVSVTIFGLVGEAKDTTECHVSAFSPDEKGASVVEIETAADLVIDTVKRFRELGKPKQKQASGKWA